MRPKMVRVELKLTCDGHASLERDALGRATSPTHTDPADSGDSFPLFIAMISCLSSSSLSARVHHRRFATMVRKQLLRSGYIDNIPWCMRSTVAARISRSSDLQLQCFSWLQGAAGSKSGARNVKANVAAVETKLNIATDVTQLIGEQLLGAHWGCCQ